MAKVYTPYSPGGRTEMNEVEEFNAEAALRAAAQKAAQANRLALQQEDAGTRMALQEAMNKFRGEQAGLGREHELEMSGSFEDKAGLRRELQAGSAANRAADLAERRYADTREDTALRRAIENRRGMWQLSQMDDAMGGGGFDELPEEYRQAMTLGALDPQLGQAFLGQQSQNRSRRQALAQSLLTSDDPRLRTKGMSLMMADAGELDLDEETQEALINPETKQDADLALDAFVQKFDAFADDDANFLGFIGSDPPNDAVIRMQQEAMEVLSYLRRLYGDQAGTRKFQAAIAPVWAKHFGSSDPGDYGADQSRSVLEGTGVSPTY